MSSNIEVQILKNNVNIPILTTLGSSGYDIYSNEEYIIPAYERRLISTGLFMKIPMYYEGQIRSRSGLAYKHGIIVLNSPGTIDSDYRGEIKILLYNTSNIDYKVQTNDRIAQIVFSKYNQADFKLVESLTITKRDHNGFGSTGYNHDIK